MNDLNELGFSIVLDFITAEEEAELVKNFVPTPVKKSARQRNGIKNRNSIRRFGSTAPYGGNIISKNIPSYLLGISQKIVLAGLLENMPDSVTINEYLPGEGIAPHIDSKASGPVITVLSLLSDATMVFSKMHQRSPVTKVALPARSVSQMRGEIRSHWQHSIEPVQYKRYSIVFRCSK